MQILNHLMCDNYMLMCLIYVGQYDIFNVLKFCSFVSLVSPIPEVANAMEV